MNKLIELASAGVSTVLCGPHSKFHYGATWKVMLSKNSDGINLEMETLNEDMTYAIDEAYERWVVATKGIQTHSLLQIDYTPSAAPIDLNDEIPF